MAKKVVYLTMKEKREMAAQGKSVPLCVRGSQNRNSFIAKLRGTIFDGTLIHKPFRI